MHPPVVDGIPGIVDDEQPREAGKQFRRVFPRVRPEGLVGDVDVRLPGTASERVFERQHGLPESLFLPDVVDIPGGRQRAEMKRQDT